MAPLDTISHERATPGAGSAIPGDETLAIIRRRVERPLDTIERIFHAYNEQGAYLTTQVARVRGALTEPLLRRALGHVQRRHPILGARIAGGLEESRWVLPDASPIALRVVPGGASAVSLCEEELHLGFNTKVEPLWRWVFQPGAGPDGPHLLLLTMHHALVDGLSASLVLTAALSACSDLADGLPLSPISMPDVPPGEWLRSAPLLGAVRHRFRRLNERLRPRRAVPPLHLLSGHDAGPRRSKVSVRVLGPSRLDALRARATTERSSLNGALLAGMAQALAAWPDPLHRLTVNVAVSLRGQARPPIPDDRVGCFAATVPVTVSLRRHRPFWTVARDATRQVSRGLRCGGVMAGIVASRGKLSGIAADLRRSVADPRTAGRLSFVTISNRGPLPDRGTGSIRLEQWFSATSNHTVGNLLQLSCGTVRGRLAMCLVHVDPPVPAAVAEPLMDGLESSLERAVSVEGSRGPARIGRGGTDR